MILLLYKMLFHNNNHNGNSNANKSVDEYAGRLRCDSHFLSGEAESTSVMTSRSSSTTTSTTDNVNVNAVMTIPTLERSQVVTDKVVARGRFSKILQVTLVNVNFPPKSQQQHDNNKQLQDKDDGHGQKLVLKRLQKHTLKKKELFTKPWKLLFRHLNKGCRQ